MQARAGAIDELIASGALEDVSAVGGGDDISRELDAMSSQADVEAELAALKGGSAPRRPIEAAEDGGDILEAEPEKHSRGRPGLTRLTPAPLGPSGRIAAWHALDSSATPGSPPG